MNCYDVKLRPSDRDKAKQSRLGLLMTPVPLKLRPYAGAIQMCILLLFFKKLAHQHKAAGRKTRLDILLL